MSVWDSQAQKDVATLALASTGGTILGVYVRKLIEGDVAVDELAAYVATNLPTQVNVAAAVTRLAHTVGLLSALGDHQSIARAFADLEDLGRRAQ